MNQDLSSALFNVFQCDFSPALVEKIQDKIQELIDSDEVETCHACGKLFLCSEQALQYEQADGEYTCECLSPANQAASIADMQYDMAREET